MPGPIDLLTDDFSYELPHERIAYFPVEPRDHSRLLVKMKGALPEDALFFDLPGYLPTKSLLVLNNTRVIHARLLFSKPSGAAIEIFCLKPRSPSSELESSFTLHSPVQWECLVGNAKKWKSGNLNKIIRKDGLEWKLSANRVEGAADNLIELKWEPAHLSFAEVMDAMGVVPLPPYIQRELVEKDASTYQTIYAARDGSVAAPTAGLHFTREVLGMLPSREIQLEYLSLHVGAGTFKPVSTASVADHSMHPEPFFIGKTLINSLLHKDYSKLIAVGTTTVRSLESLYWFGVKIRQGRPPVDGRTFFLDQWDAYEMGEPNVSLKDAMQSVLDYMEENDLEEIRGITRLMIAPPYTYRVVEGMLTNFHQPKSTLLLLVAAFIGPEWKDAYSHALEKAYRFLSYGDACLFMNA